MRSFKYILILLALSISARVWGQYNPSNPAEPGAPVKQYTLTLVADPSGGGSFNLNATSSQTEGTTFWVQANTAANFTFVNWTDEQGEEISNVYRFQYTMPSHDAKLIAHFTYTPNAPGEPSEAIVPPKPVYAPLWLTAQPAAGCSFNIASGNNYEVGTNVSVKANVASNFKFVNWTKDGVEISTANPFSYTMLEGDEANQLVANLVYDPNAPTEPTERLYHKVFLISNPAGGGTFNVASGNEYEQGTNQTFRAYNSTWYTFTKWTLDGEEVSTNSVYTFPIPEKDITLTAHFEYNYNPSNPAEPSASTSEELALYGMTQNGVRGQTINYPVILENTAEVPNMTVVVKFPEGFDVQTASTALAERAAGKTLTVTPVPSEGNAYRFDITGGTAITGNNGKVFDVPVTISETATEGTSYEVVLKNGARINSDESTTVINSTRKGYIYVEEQREDGLYASFTFDKFQNRFQFKNQSSDKALEWTWNFGDGTSSTERNPLHTYAAEGTYDVTLTVKGETGTDVAMMSVLVNNKNTWRVNGTLFLDTEEKGVRYFTSTSSLLTFMAASPINSDVTVMVKQGETFACALSESDISHLSTINSQLSTGGYTLTLQRNGEGTVPTMGFGNESEVVKTEVVGIFTALGKNLAISNVNLKLWGIIFDPTKIDELTSQTVKSGEQTAAVDFAPISTGLTFTWKAADDTPEVLSGYTAEGTGSIPQMTISSSSTEDAQIIYNVVGKKGEETFCSFTHTITVTPALEGEFTNLQPANGTSLDALTVQLQWNGISNAVYDVYLWNAVNQKPATPSATGITETTFTSTNFCQDGKSYKWQVVARNATQQIESQVMNFSVQLLPNLHVSTITLPAEIEAGTNATIKWTVRNDGIGGTNGKAWTDRVWLVPDVYGGTGQKSCLLLKSVANVKDLPSGEEYEGSAEISLTEEQYGSYYILVASDMSSVTSIDWEKAGGSIVNPYEPTTAEYGYLMATTEAAGNLVKEQGETATRSDNFFYVKAKIDMPQMVEEEWNLLKQAYQEMGDGEGWTKKWDFDVERRTVQSLPGVSILGGHVVSINLSNNGLTGDFPFTLLSLPKLEALNLSGNQLTGDIGESMETFLADKTEFTSKLTAVNLADNQLGGNIGKFAEPLTALTTLYASDNNIADVSPVISDKVTTLTLQNQTIDKVVTIDVNKLNTADVWAQIPTVLLYDHATQGYAEKIRLACADTDSEWSLTMDCTPTSVPVSPEDFDGPNAKVLATQVVDDSDQPTGCTLKVKFLFVLPNLHVSTITLPTELEAGTKPTIKWTVRNDGDGGTDGKTWTDRVWLVTDVTGGTGETDCKLLAEVANVKDLASGKEYEGSAEIDLNEDEYGSYYILVASDMSTVTDIDWATAGGEVVNPYEPATADYGYLMATTEAAGNLVREFGETTTRSDNFFYVKVTIGMPQMSEEEWNVLKQAYQEMGNGEGWTKMWDFDVTHRTIESLPGVTISGGSVTSIDLSDNGVTGTFPYTLLSLPKLESLNLSGNQLTGDIGEGMETFLADKEGFTSKLMTVDIADNQLGGNIGKFAEPLTDLTTLYASGNGIADVSPVISNKVTTLTLENQTIDKVVTIDVNNSEPDEIWAQIPTVLLYDHATQGYAETVRLSCTDADSGWSLTMDCTPTTLPVPRKNFEGPSDKVLTAQVVDDSDQPTGCTLKVKFLYDPTSIYAVGEAKYGRAAGVYDMGGKKVAKTATSLKGLPVGTYIIGGRKVTVER